MGTRLISDLGQGLHHARESSPRPARSEEAWPAWRPEEGPSDPEVSSRRMRLFRRGGSGRALDGILAVHGLVARPVVPPTSKKLGELLR